MDFTQTIPPRLFYEGGGGELGGVGRAELFPYLGNCHGWHDRGLIVLSSIRNPHVLKVFPEFMRRGGWEVQAWHGSWI